MREDNKTIINEITKMTKKMNNFLTNKNVKKIREKKDSIEVKKSDFKKQDSREVLQDNFN